MSDNLKRKEEESFVININENWEVDYWSGVLFVSKEELIAAVKLVGPSIDDVKKFLLKD